MLLLSLDVNDSDVRSAVVLLFTHVGYYHYSCLKQTTKDDASILLARNVYNMYNLLLPVGLI